MRRALHNLQSHLPCFLLCLLVGLSAAGCYRHADKTKSDIAGIIPQQGSDAVYPAVEARYSSWPDPDTLLISISGERHKVAASGNVYNLKGQRIFNIGNEGGLEILYYLQKNNDFFIFFSDITSDGSASFAKRIDLSTGKTLWSREISGVAMGRPIIRGQFAYMQLYGFVGKLKLKDGTFDWQFANLNSNGRFEKFREVLFPSSNEVLFVAPHTLTNKCDTIVVNDMTGEMLRMN